jgi:phosphonate transport system permease protein
MTTAPAAAEGPLANAPSLPARPSRTRATYAKAALGIALAALLIYAWTNVGGSISEFISGLFGKKGIFQGIVKPSLPPDTSAIGEGLKASVTTFCVALLSIFFGVVISVLMLPFAARNLTPNRPAFELTRGIQAVLRAIPELIMILLFLVTVGIGPFSAVIALTFHGIGVKGKLFAEAVEEMDMAPVDALRVSGASRTQVFLHAVLPGARNTLIGLTLYRLDANFRSAVTLGAVGGGGIGFLIFNEVNDYQFQVVATYLIIMVIWVLAIERLSAILRARL